MGSLFRAAAPWSQLSATGRIFDRKCLSRELLDLAPADASRVGYRHRRRHRMSQVVSIRRIPEAYMWIIAGTKQYMDMYVRIKIYGACRSGIWSRSRGQQFMWSEIIRPKRGEDSAAELLLESSSFPARVATIETAYCVQGFATTHEYWGTHSELESQ